MELIQAVRTRRSIRGFKRDAVPKEVLEAIMDVCRWSPSWTNTQSWEFAIAGGTVMQELKSRMEKHTRNEETVHPEIPMPRFPQLYEQRSVELRNSIDISQFPPGTENLDQKRYEYLLHGSRWHDAPNGIVIYTEKFIGPASYFDMGIIAQTIALVAHDYGLGTCMMARVVRYPEDLREMLNIPPSKIIVIGIAIGYPDSEALCNTFERQRESVHNFCHWYGF